MVLKIKISYQRTLFCIYIANRPFSYFLQMENQEFIVDCDVVAEAQTWWTAATVTFGGHGWWQ
jgi:hypothetical protein